MVNCLSIPQRQPMLSIPCVLLYLKIALFPFSVHVENTIIPAEGNKNHMQSHYSELNTVNVLVYNQ